MMPDNDNPWFRFGNAVERALQALSSPGGTVAELRRAAKGGGERKGRRRKSSPSGGRVSERFREVLDRLPMDDENLAHVLDGLFAAGAGTLANRVLERFSEDRTSAGSLLRAGAAGAGAALLLEIVRPLLEEDREPIALDSELGYALLEGIGRGLVYGALLQRRIPGPHVVKGAVYGTADYLIGPWGGISHLLHSVSPQRSLPVIGPLLQPRDSAEDTLVEHLVFGTALAVLSGIGTD